MSYPPTVPPNTRADNTPLPTNHIGDHNDISDALTDIINELGSNPKGDAADLTANLALLSPLGVVLPYAGASAPSGWALCDGSAISRTTYAELFALIGTTYGSGDGSTTFNLPDLSNRFIAGKGTGATWSDALAETGGSKDAVAVAHTHTFNHDHPDTFAVVAGGGSHAHTEGSETGQGWLYNGAYNGVRFNVFTGHGLDGAASTYGYTQPSTGTGGSTHNHTISGAVSNNGTGDVTAGQTPTASATNANLPPYLTLNHIIRVT